MERALEVAGRVLQILQDGAFTATYKQAVLVAMLDLCLEKTQRKGAPPGTLTTRELAEKIVEIYWPQTRTWDEGTEVLVQSAGTARGHSNARIVKLIANFRSGIERGVDRGVALERARRTASGYERLVREVEWTLVKMPLPRLQRVGGEDTRWLYTIGWDDGAHSPTRGSVSAYQRGRPSVFDNVIRLQPGVPEAFAQLHGILRPFILQHWALKVASLNRLDEGRLHEFLFGVHRTSLVHLVEPLLELQHGECFYCGRRIGSQPEVDHFIPWSRFPDNGLDNLVAVHDGCNAAKLDFLAASDHLGRWRERAEMRRAELVQLADAHGWDAGGDRTLGVARALYLNLPADSRLWVRGRDFEAADRRVLAGLLG